MLHSRAALLRPLSPPIGDCQIRAQVLLARCHLSIHSLRTSSLRLGYYLLEPSQQLPCERQPISRHCGQPQLQRLGAEPSKVPSQFTSVTTNHKPLPLSIISGKPRPGKGRRNFSSCPQIPALWQPARRWGDEPTRTLGCRLQAHSAMSTMGVTGVATPSVPVAFTLEEISYLRQAEAQAVDEELMGPLGFSIDQLMELAGLSVACAIAEVYSASAYGRVLVVCGPGNNGGDGLVAARHLYHFGYRPIVCYPKRTDKALYKGLVIQLESLGLPFVHPDELPQRLSDSCDLVVDAMFGFSFHGVPRPPFDAVLRQLCAPAGGGEVAGVPPPVVSVDVPSGWDVEAGDAAGTGLRPEMLVSLTAPKECARRFVGPHHFLGGRFVPPAIAQKYGLRLPAYQGAAMCVRIGPAPKRHVDVAALREDYLGEVLLEESVRGDPIEQFREWFEEAVAQGVAEPNAMSLATTDKNGRPSARMVLLKGFDSQGFVWFTSYGSRKGRELLSRDRSRAALVFWWPALHRQVRVEGEVVKVSSEESDEYFHSRPRGSQLGAATSPQSAVIPGRYVLDELYQQLCNQYPEGVEIPRPENWGGFRLRPDRVEFWQGRASRLHDRLRYTLKDEGSTPVWGIERLAP